MIFLRKFLSLTLVSQYVFAIFLAAQTSYIFAGQIATGRAHSCAWDGVPGSQIVCWGIQFSGKTNNLPTVKHLMALHAGSWHTCAHYINKEKKQELNCWGDDGFGVLSPSVTDYEQVLSLSVGEWHNCAVFKTKDQKRILDCWGREDVGQTKIPEDLEDVESVFAGLDYSCALLRESRQVRCWGRSDTTAVFEKESESVLAGTLACKKTSKSSQPRCWLNASHNFNDFRSHRFGRDITVEKNVIKSLDKDNSDGSEAVEKEIKDAMIGKTVIDVAVGEDHVCVIDTQGIMCKGDNLEGQEEVPEELKEMGPVFHRVDHLRTFLERLRLKVYSFDAMFLTSLLEKIDSEDVGSNRNMTLIYFTELFIRQLGYSHLQTLYLKNSALHMLHIADPSQFTIDRSVYISALISLLDTAKVQLDMQPRSLVSEGITELGTQLAIGAETLSPKGCEKLREISDVFAMHHYLYNRAINIEDAITRLCK